MRNPFTRSSPAPAPGPAPDPAPAPAPAPQRQVAPVLYTAVSNHTWNNLPVGAGQPGDEATFKTAAEAIAWLRALRCGGTVVILGERIVAEIPPGD